MREEKRGVVFDVLALRETLVFLRGSLERICPTYLTQQWIVFFGTFPLETFEFS